MIKAILIVEGDFDCIREFDTHLEFDGFREGLAVGCDLYSGSASLWIEDDLAECDKDFPAIANLIREHLIEKEESDE